MRYFRLSQTTTDLFDAFRNLYLALESLLSTVEPMRMRPNGRPESEREWLNRALRAAEQAMLAHNPAQRLGSYLQPADDATGATAADAVVADLWTSARTTVFHAKKGRAVALPQHDPDRAAVADDLNRYAGSSSISRNRYSAPASFEVALASSRSTRSLPTCCRSGSSEHPAAGGQPSPTSTRTRPRLCCP